MLCCTNDLLLVVLKYRGKNHFCQKQGTNKNIVSLMFKTLELALVLMWLMARSHQMHCERQALLVYIKVFVDFSNCRISLFGIHACIQTALEFTSTKPRFLGKFLAKLFRK